MFSILYCYLVNIYFKYKLLSWLAGFITKTAMSRNKKAVNMVTYSNRIHRSVPPLPNEDASVDIEEEEEDGNGQSHTLISSLIF